MDQGTCDELLSPRQDHARRRARRRLALAGPRCHPRNDRRFPLPAGTALSAWRLLGRKLLLRHARPRRAEEGSARSARPGRRSTLPIRGLRTHRGYRDVAAGHDRPRRLRAGLRRLFLMRPELIDRWDLRIFVSSAFEKTVDRVVIYNGRWASVAEVRRRWRERYVLSQQSYWLRSTRPITPTSSCTNDEPSSRSGRPEHTDRAQFG